MKNAFIKRRQNSGFTIVELIVVIVVIAILATITLVSYNVIRDKAKATAIVSEITKVEEAFHLMAADQFTANWWRDTTFTGANNPTFDSIINGSNSAYPNAALFKKYIPEVPTVSGMNLSWTYDNDGDTPTGDVSCVGTNWPAVLIYITPIDKAIQQIIDDKMDDGELTCGKVRRNNDTSMLYQLSWNQKI